MFYEDKTIVDICEIDGEKHIHYLGYGYYSEDGTETPYRFLEYTWLIAPLRDALDYGIAKWESDNQEFVKQYISDVSETELDDIYEHYDNGKKPKVIKADDISIETPCGLYIVDMGY